jgi:hypothetical protein
MTIPRLPFTLAPLSGESFDSWFEAYAARLDVVTGDLAAAIGLPTPYLRTPIGTLLARGLTPSLLARVGEATGLDPTSVDTMFHRAGLTPTARRAVVARAISNAWAPTAGTRFCPACLCDNGGRFQLNWRLPWTFLCLTHNVPLVDGCSECRRPPRARHITVRRRPALGRCCTPAGQTRRTTSPCGADLSGAESSIELDIVACREAQQFINAQLTLAAAGHRDGLDALIDLTIIALHLTSPGPIGSRRVRGHMLHAATLATAFGLLTDTAAGRRADPLAAFAQSRVQDLGRTTAIPESWRPASPATTARIAHGRDGCLAATERIRHATTLATPTARSSSGEPAVHRARWVPDQIWSAWVVRLTNDDSSDPVRLRPAAAVALLLPHSALKLPAAAALLSPQLRGDAVEHQLTSLAKTANGTAALRLLTQLGLGIDAHGSPIDYGRRRRLVVAATELIDAFTWKRYTRRSHFFKGGRRRLRFAGCYLYELLTGGALSLAPPHYSLSTHLRAQYLEFVLALPAPLVAALQDHAQTFLTSSGITDEPLQWQPPSNWVTVDTWPGADPDQTAPGPLHRDLHNGDTPSLVANRHGMSMEHLRHVIRQNPMPGRTEPSLRPGAIRPHGPDAVPYRPTAGTYQVNLAWLHEQYVTWRRSIADIASEIGCNAKSLASFTRQHGIPMRPRGGGRHAIPPGTTSTHPADLPNPLRSAIAGQNCLQRIERFLTIADHSSLNQAALSIGVSTSTVSQALDRLEQRCGGPLFDRPRGRLGNLTPLGERLHQQAHRFLSSTATSNAELP